MDTRERVAGELSRWVHLLFGGRAPEKVVFDVEAGRLCAIFAEERAAAAKASHAYADDCESLREQLEDAKAREAALREVLVNIRPEFETGSWPANDIDAALAVKEGK